MLKIDINRLILTYTLIALFIIAFMEIESAGAVPIKVFYFPYNKSLWLLIMTIIFSILIIAVRGFKKKDINGVLVLLILKCGYDILAIFQGRVVADATFWYHYSMVLVMPFLYYIYRCYSGRAITIIKLFTWFAVVLVIQEIFTIIFNGYAFTSFEYKNYLRLPVAHSNIIAVILLSILIIRLRCCPKHEIVDIIIGIGILLIQSRGAILFVICWWLLIQYERKYGRLTKTAIIKLTSVLLLIVCVICLTPALQMILFETTISNVYFWSKATSGRTDLLLLGIVKFLQNPIFGSGLGVEDYDLGYEVVQAGVHNILLDYLIQSGIIGTIIYGGALYFVFKNKCTNEKINISNGFALSIWMILGYSMVEVCYFNFSCIFFFWAICGLYDRIKITSGKELLY